MFILYSQKHWVMLLFLNYQRESGGLEDFFFSLNLHKQESSKISSFSYCKSVFFHLCGSPKYTLALLLAFLFPFSRLFLGSSGS